jgi:uncharacterized protein YbjT (DUF2867 family)
MILVTGAAGFVGGHLVARLLEAGHSVRCLVRAGGSTGDLPTDRVEIVYGDVTELETLGPAVAGVDTVIHLVAIIKEPPGATFHGIHVDGTSNMLISADSAGVKRFFFMSALGTRPEARSKYHQTKWQAEELTRRSGMQYVIFRPSLIFGPKDGFTTQIMDLARKAPVIPVPGNGRSLVQPIWIGDVAGAITKTVEDDSLWGTTWEIGGSRQMEFNEAVDTITDVMGVRKRKFHMPVALLRPVVMVLERVWQGIPAGSDALLMLQEPNICDPRTLPDRFGIAPLPFREGLLRYVPGQAAASPSPA